MCQRAAATRRVNIIYLDKSIKTKQNKLLFQIYGIRTIDNNPESNRPSLNAATTAAPTSEAIQFFRLQMAG